MDSQTDADQCRALHHRGTQGVRSEDLGCRGEDVGVGAAHLYGDSGIHLQFVAASVA